MKITKSKDKNKVGVIIEVMDIFNKIKNFEAIPDSTIEKEEYKKYEKEEYKAHEKIINEIIEEWNKKGFKCVGFYNHKEVDKKLNRELSLGLNGVYLLIFKKFL